MPEVLHIHQTFSDCLSNQYIYFDMPDVTTSYERFSGLIELLKISIFDFGLLGPSTAFLLFALLR